MNFLSVLALQLLVLCNTAFAAQCSFDVQARTPISKVGYDVLPSVRQYLQKFNSNYGNNLAIQSTYNCAPYYRAGDKSQCNGVRGVATLPDNVACKSIAGTQTYGNFKVTFSA